MICCEEQYMSRMFGDNECCENNSNTNAKNDEICCDRAQKALDRAHRGLGCGPVGKVSCTRAQKALDRAHDIRKFEIELLWKRAAYVATFQTLLFAALGLSFYSDNNDAFDISSNSASPMTSIFQLIICIAGVFTSYFWRLINKGSKFWHENWSNHIDFLENQYEGRLHKTVLHDEEKRLPFSVSRVNIAISTVFFAAWCFLLVFILDDIFNFLDSFTFQDTVAESFVWTIPLSLVIVIVATLFWLHHELKSKFNDVDSKRKMYWKKRELPRCILPECEKNKK